MLKLIIAFTIGEFFLSLLDAKFLIFGREDINKWQEKTFLRRFCDTFFPTMILFLIFVGINEYKAATNPNTIGQSLSNNEQEYVRMFGMDEIGDADMAFEIKQGYTSAQIRTLILKIIRDQSWKIIIPDISDNPDVSFENGEYMITDKGKNIGRVTTYDMKVGVLLRFYWY